MKTGDYIKTINELTQKLNGANGVSAEIELQLQEAWNKVFADSTKIRDAVALLYKSNDYAWFEHDELCCYISFDVSDFRDSRQWFTEYMREHEHVEVDWENDALTRGIGPAIVINSHGDVYDQDSGKFFVSKNDYREEGTGELNEGKRNELIEAYMKRLGYYPGVFESYNGGSVFLVDTRSKSEIDSTK